MSSANRLYGVRFGVHKLACALGVAIISVSSQADTVTLKNEAYVKGPTVHLGDVATIEGANADFLAQLEVTPAALPGGLKRVNAALVLSKIADAGLAPEDVQVTGAPSVTATTRHLEITREMIQEDLRRFIEINMPWNLDETIVEVERPVQSYVVPDGELEFRWRANPQYGYLGGGSFRGDLLVDGSVEKSFHVAARVETYGEVVIAAADISRGDPLSARNLRLEKRELSAVDQGAYFDVSDLNGFLAKTNHFAGQTITARKVMPPTLVKRGQVAVVETTVGSLTIQTRAKALADGVAGDLVRCENLKSEDEFVGVVRNDGVVVVK